MISKYNHKELNWIDLESPKTEEIEYVIEQYKIPRDIGIKIISKNISEINKISHDTIHVSTAHNIIFIISEEFIVTIHDEPMQAFNNFSSEMEIDAYGSEKINSHKLLFAYILKNLYANSQTQIYLNQERIEILESKIQNKIRKIKKMKIYILILLVLLIISIIWL